MSVEFTILRCLIDQPAHGYRLQRILASLVHYFPLRNVNVYPALRELENKGRVRSTTEIAGSRARRVYVVTDQGRAEFEQWLRSPPETHVPEVRDPVCLRLALATESPGELAWLVDSTETVAAETERATVRFETGAASMTPLAQLAARELIHNLHRRRAFLERAHALARTTGTAARSHTDSSRS